MKKFMGLLGIILLAGCATSSHVMTGNARSSISPESVKIYTSMPEGAQKIALVNCTANSLKVDSCVESLKKDAAKLGANGLLIEKSEAHYFQGSAVTGQAIFVP